jgi:hypothetical protein
LNENGISTCSCYIFAKYTNFSNIASICFDVKYFSYFSVFSDLKIIIKPKSYFRFDLKSSFSFRKWFLFLNFVNHFIFNLTFSFSNHRTIAHLRCTYIGPSLALPRTIAKPPSNTNEPSPKITQSRQSLSAIAHFLCRSNANK